jgi:hypothetical protein
MYFSERFVAVNYMNAILDIVCCLKYSSYTQRYDSYWTSYRVIKNPDSYSEGHVLNLDPETGYPDWGFCGFPQSLQENTGILS